MLGRIGIPLLHSPRMKLRGVVPVLLAGVLAACSRPEPSPDYASAREKHAALLAARPGDAAGTAEMAEVLRLLEAVPEQSADAPAARELRDRLVAEREAFLEEASRREVLLAKAGEAPAWTLSAEAAAPATRIAPGMTAGEFAALHGSCFERRPGEYRLDAGAGNPSRSVESWAVNGEEECREKYASHLDQLILIGDGAILAVRPASEAKPVTEEKVVRRQVEREVQLVPLAEGGWGMRGADGKVEPIPAGAEIRDLDGKPLAPPPPGARP
jgi:hypothetical protein